MNILKFLGGTPALIVKTFVILRKIVPESTLREAIKLATQAATQFTDNDQRRAWAVAELQQLGIPESIARLAVEMAVAHLKADLIDTGQKKSAVPE